MTKTNLIPILASVPALVVGLMSEIETVPIQLALFGIFISIPILALAMYPHIWNSYKLDKRSRALREQTILMWTNRVAVLLLTGLAALLLGIIVLVTILVIVQGNLVATSVSVVSAVVLSQTLKVLVADSTYFIRGIRYKNTI